MALNLYKQVKGTIVDRICEFDEKGKEHNLMDVSRGVIVEVDGDPEQEEVAGLYVCFGQEREVKNARGEVVIHQKDEVEVNGIAVPCAKVKAAELAEVYPHDSRVAKETWRRLFRIPVQVGVVLENRKAKSGRRRKVTDSLGLTPGREEGLIKEDLNPGGMKDLPTEEA